MSTYTMAWMESMGPSEQFFLIVDKRCSAPIHSTIVAIVLHDFSLATGYQTDRDRLNTNIIIAVKTDVSCDGTPCTALDI